MYSSFAKHAIFFLLVLSDKFTFASVNNITRGEERATKIFTRFLRVPWINWNTPWIHEVQSACGNDIATLFKSAVAGELWALQMLDAASKIPSGLLTGNIYDLGMYDECVRVKPHHNSANIQGRHCMVSMSIPTKFVEDAGAIMSVQRLSVYNPTADVALSFSASLCVPSSCSVDDITDFINASVNSTLELDEFQVQVARVTCSSIESETEVFTLGRVLTISFFAVIVTFLLFCTACDFWLKTRPHNVSSTLKIFAKFSFRTNAIKLLDTKTSPDTMPAIHGIRFLSMFSMVLMHRVLNTFIKPMVNLSDFQELQNSLPMQFIIMLSYVVDTFFTLTGFLTAHLFLKTLRSGQKFNLFQLYVHRYLRLVPCLVAVILIETHIIPYFGSGPVWEIVIGLTSEFCQKNWWTNLLYIQNFVNPQEMCMLSTWYLAVDMQLFWICPIVLYPLFYRPKLGLVTLSVFIIVCFFTPAIQILLNQYSFFFNMNKPFHEDFAEFLQSYIVTYNRALPYFIGIFLGYYVVNEKEKLTQVQAAIGWIFTSIFLILCFWNTYYVQPSSIVYFAAWEAAFVSFGRLGWSLAIAWIIYACTQGHGGPVTAFLSLPIFVPISRLSYCIYLVSVPIQVGVISTIRTAEFFSSFGIACSLWSDLVISIAAAFVLSLCFETPLIVLEKMLIAKRKPFEFVEPSIKKNQKLLTIMREYLNLSGDQVVRDAEIGIRTPHSDFWRTVSAVLTALGKGTTKTPAEWKKTWQDWKLELSKNGNESKTRVRDMQDASVKSQIGITTLEKELLIFLATVSSGLDDETRLQVLETKEPRKSQLGSCMYFGK